jgi:hypothetical protein
MTIGNAVFEVFHTDVAKLDRDIAYVAIIVHLCCKCLFPVFYLFFRHMLYMFHTYVSSILSGRYVMFAIVFKCFSGVFASVSETCFKCFIYLLCMLQVLYLNVLKLDWDVAHRMCVGIGRLRERSPTRGLAARAKSGRQGLLLELSLASLTLLGRLLACCTGTARALVPRIGCLGASKSDFHEKKNTYRSNFQDQYMDTSQFELFIFFGRELFIFDIPRRESDGHVYPPPTSWLDERTAHSR